MRKTSLFQKLGIHVDGRKFHLHHIDLDRSNNDIENLIILERGIHYAVHSAIRMGATHLKRRIFLQRFLQESRGRYYKLVKEQEGFQMGKTIIENYRCPECTSTLTFCRTKTKVRVCRKCSHEWPAGKSGK